VISQYFSPALFLFALGSSPYLLAQDIVDTPEDKDEAVDSAPVTVQTLSYTPLTLKQKYTYSLKLIFSGPRVISLLTRAGFDSTGKSSDGWGTGADAYGIRLASRFGRSLLRQNIAFGIRALDHEDPRYFPSQSHNAWKRTKDAMAQTFVCHNDNGNLMPAYSRFIADFGMPFVAQQWRPESTRTVAEGFRSGGISLGMGVGINVATEFWPDFKKELRTRFRLAAKLFN
jgi:hypothetical protein